jgi:oligopeptide/dipeptide ABC transporter ATP-binding protein
MNGPVLLQVDHLKLYYGSENRRVKAVEDVNLKIDKGQRVGLVGESGCGKSTVARAILRLLPPNSETLHGQVLFNGVDLLTVEEKEIRKIRGGKIAMLFQDPMTFLNPVMRIGDQIAEAVMAHNDVTKQLATGKVLECLELVRMPSPSETLRYYPHQLSGGMRQRAMMAMALSCNPELIILEEPTTALDVLIQYEILEMLKDLNRRLDLTMLVISHDLAVVANLCQRVAVMYAGNIVEVAATAELLKNPLHPYTRGLLESFPRLEGHGRLNTIQGKVPDLSEPPAGCRFHPRCPSAMDRCKSEPPRLLELTPGHHVSCYLHEGNGAQTD